MHGPLNVKFNCMITSWEAKSSGSMSPGMLHCVAGFAFPDFSNERGTFKNVGTK